MTLNKTQNKTQNCTSRQRKSIYKGRENLGHLNSEREKSNNKNKKHLPLKTANLRDRFSFYLKKFATTSYLLVVNTILPESEIN